MHSSDFFKQKLSEEHVFTFKMKNLLVYCRIIIFILYFLSAINRPCTEEGSNKISATYNRTIFDLHGTAGICLYRVNYDQPQLKREVLVCLDKTSPDPVCAGNNYTNPCTVIGETEITGNGTTQKTYFNVPGWNTTYVVSFKFKGEGHFYPVEEDICWRIWNISKVQGK